MNNFLEELAVPGIAAETWGNLEADLTKQEVLDATEKLSGGRLPGPDRFPMDFYKAFASSLITPLIYMLGYYMFKHPIEIYQ